LAEGVTSLLWQELSNLLPCETFSKLAAIAGYKPEAEAPRHTWQDLTSKFEAWMTQRVPLDKLRESTREHYAPFVRELRERARRIMETGQGLEITGTPRAQQKIESGKIQ
jgi:hypothetical protein